MSYAYCLQVRLKKHQIDKIRQDSQRKGFKRVSEYVRWTLIHNPTELEEKINLIYQKIQTQKAK